MKTRNQFEAIRRIAGLIAMAIIALAVIGCKQDEPTPEPQPYGTLPNGVGIYKGDASITDAEMATAVQNAIAGYNGVTDPARITEINRILTRVIIISHKSYTWDGHILGIKYDTPNTNITGILSLVGSGNLPLAE